MGLPVGTIWQLVIESVVSGQRCLNVLHYRCTTESTISGISAETEAVAADLNSVDGIIPKLLPAMGPNVNIPRVTGQAIRTTRYAKQSVEVDEDGSHANLCTTPNVAAVITKRTTFAGRWAVGSFHVPGVPGTAYSEGMLTTDYKDIITLLAAELLDNLEPAVGGGVYEPILLHPAGLHGGFTTLTECIAQDQVRVMRRRTVGLGI